MALYRNIYIWCGVHVRISVWGAAETVVRTVELALALRH